MLYEDMPKRARVKQRATFRLDESLLEALRTLPNQTAFVERTLARALGQLCPLCRGAGEVPGVHMNVSDLKRLPGRQRLDRAAASQLKALVRVGRALLATDLELEAEREGEQIGFKLARANELLLTGRIPRSRRAGRVEPGEVTLAN